MIKITVNLARQPEKIVFLKQRSLKKLFKKKNGGRSLIFKENGEQRKLPRKIITGGYVAFWIAEDKKYVREHRIIWAKHNNKSHNDITGIVHHINTNKKDNKIENLIELTVSEHRALHFQLEGVSQKLIDKNLIIFDKDQKKYILSPEVEQKNFDISLGFEDIAIKQSKNICKSRLDVNIESEIIRGIKRPIPLIASNMSTVVNSDFCIRLYKFGALGILHRADTDENILSEIKKISLECDHVAASIGVDNNQFDFAKKIIKNGCNIINIDVAHGYSDLVLDLAKKIKKYSPNTKVIIGNTTNINLLYESYTFVDAIKVGIAQGFACETKNTAGCTEKQFSAVFKFKTQAKNFGIPIISDGGIREPADFTKAIAAGSSSVMAGSVFAACPESAAEIININGIDKKIYAGMASEYVQKKWRGGLKEGTCAEGGVRYLDLGLPLEKILELYSGALRSGITYAGGNDIKSFQNNVEFVRFK